MTEIEQLRARCAELEARLAEIGKQEPVAFMYPDKTGPLSGKCFVGGAQTGDIPLYTHAPDSAARIAELEAENAALKNPDFRQMREMLRAMQAGELTVGRGVEILEIWHAGNWNDNMLPPVRQDLIEEDSMPVEIIDRLKLQLAASQARELQLRAGIEAIQDYAQECIDRRVLEYGEDFRPGRLKMMREDLALAQQALSTPSDTTALEALIQRAGEVMRERMLEMNGDWSAMIADAIRALPAVTLGDLKG